MKQSDLKELLIKEAKRKGICVDGLREMVDNVVSGMVDYYLQMIDWCLERDFPSLSVLKDSFSDCEEKGIYVCKDFEGEEFKGLQAYVFHNCKGRIRVAMDYEKAVIPMLYFANGCELEVSCEQDNGTHPIRVPLYVFGEGEKVRVKGGAKFVHYQMETL